MKKHTSQLERAFPILLASFAMLIGGCSTTVPPKPGSSASFRSEMGAFTQMPRARMGALPFPGPFTLYTSADTSDLGQHAYDGSTDAGTDPETDRGIVYTRRAGFFDISHVRNAADMTAYLHARTQLAITNEWESMRFRAHEPSDYTVSFDYPKGWNELPDEQRAAISDELAIRVAQRLAHDVMNWHEIITWYGYKSTVVFSEQGSAFTYEDTTSHALGIELAGQALRRGGDFDAQMTDLLDRSLQDLQAVDSKSLEHAIDSVEGEWWSFPGTVRRRMLDIGLDDGVIKPWLVPDLECDRPVVFRLPDLHAIGGIDFSSFCSLAIDPNVLEGYKVRNRLEGSPERVDPEAHFPVLLADIAEHVDDSIEQDERAESTTTTADRQ